MPNGIETTFNNIVERSEKNIPKNEKDYIGKDGLLYCYKCNTPKQCRIPNPFRQGEISTVSCICSCRQQELAAEKEAEKQKERQRRIREYKRIGFPESDMLQWNFANDDMKLPKLTNTMKKYVENFAELKQQGKGLLLFGTVGTGKTFAAACVANALIDKGYPCLVTNFARIANTVQGTFEKQAYYDSLNQYSLLVLDDLAAERKTDYMQEIVYNVIDSRYRAGLPLIVTTNLTNDELKHPADIINQRTFSRLFEMCIPIEVAGKDRRRGKLKDDFAKMRDLLEL